MTAEALNNPAFLIADTETTGLRGPACEIAWYEIDPVSLDVIDEFVTLVDPQEPIEEGAQAIHGISDADVADAPTLVELRDIVLQNRFAERDVVLICHNVAFDIKRLTPLFPSLPFTICTMIQARRHYPDAPNHKLGTLHNYFGFPENKAHRALADVETTHQILRTMLNKLGMTLEQFMRNTDHTVHTMPYGQHKGKLVLDLPLGYLCWLWNRDELDENMRNSVKKALELHGHKPKKNQVFDLTTLTIL